VLFLVFQLGQDRYAFNTAHVAEVLPLVGITPVPQAPAGVAGVFNHHGTPVPVIDLSELTIGRPAERRLNTRIVLVHYPDREGTLRLLGLIAERASEVVRHEPTDFVSSGIVNGRTSCLGPVVADARGLIQWIDVGTLLSPAVRDVLFDPPDALPDESDVLREQEVER
jgi:chemotaxis-related protein WspB